MSEKITNGGISQGSISPHRPLGTIWTLMAGMVAMLMLIGATSVPAEQTPTESVKHTIDDVIHVINNEELKQPSHAVERRQKIEHVSVTSLWRYFYYVRGTGRSAADQFCVTRGWYAHSCGGRQ
jgi:hypothetical protein